MSNEERWGEIVEGLRPLMDARHATREAALQRCRLLIQTSSKCIRHVHRNQFKEARDLLNEARGIAASAREILEPHPDLLYSGYLQDAEKEMVEAAAVLAIAEREPIPSPDYLGVGPTSYLNGMGEAASECRRYVLDLMRQSSLKEAEAMLRTMEAIYDDLITFDFPDSLTGGLRRTCDALRAVIERTRSDLTMTMVQTELKQELQRARQPER